MHADTTDERREGTMRVGYLTYGLDRSPTGIGRYAIELLHALAALPDAPEIVLLTTEREDHHGLWDRFEHHALPGCRLVPALMVAGNPLLSIATRRYGLDIIHDPNGIAPFFGPRMGARRVVTIHDTLVYVYPETHNRLDTWRFRWMLPQATTRADMVLTDSDCSRADIQRYLAVPGEKVRAFPIGVNAAFHPIPAGAERDAVLARYSVEPPYLLYVGGITGRKNIARLFEAYAQVRVPRPDLRLVIGGKRQWHTEEMDMTFRRLDIAGQVRFTGYVDDADLPALYSAAEAFVFPSLYEGFGLPPLEAMACGTPVITSNTSSLPEAVGDAGLQVDPYDVDALANAITRVLTDDTLRTHLRERGIVRAAQFTWQRVAEGALATYRTVLGPRE